MSRMTIPEAIDWMQKNPGPLNTHIGTLVSAQMGLREDPTHPEHLRASNFVIDQVEAERDVRTAEEQSYAFDQGEFAATACDCKPGEPCCLRAFEVKDKDDGERKVVWPIPTDGPTKLFMVAKEGDAGRPGAKVDVEMTDFNACCNTLENKPELLVDGFTHAPDSITSKDELLINTAFQMPDFATSLIPTNLAKVIWLLGIMIKQQTYDNNRSGTIAPSQCADPSGEGLEVVAVPYLKIDASVVGEVSLTLQFGTIPDFDATLTGTANAQFGNQTIEYKSEGNYSDGPTTPSRGGTPSHPIFSFLEKIHEAMTDVADASRVEEYELRNLVRKKPTSLKIALAVTVEAPSLELKGKGGSPNLELAIDGFGMSFGPTVTGTVDLLEIMLKNIPYGDEIRDALAHKGRSVSASAECSITITGGGTLGFSVDDAVNIEIGSADGWKGEFGKIKMVYEAKCELTGVIKASARLDVRTFFFDASATAGVEVSTGWEFGRRVSALSDGTQKWEKLYHFQGIILKAYASVSLGSEAREETSNDLFESEDGTREVTTGNTTTLTSNTELAKPDWEAELMPPTSQNPQWVDA